MADETRIVYVVPHWMRVRRGDFRAIYHADRWCSGVPGPYDVPRITLENARLAGFRPCVKCWPKGDRDVDV